MTTSETLTGGPDREPWSSKQKTVLGVGLAALMTVACGVAYQHNRSQKLPTLEEQQAQASIQKVFATMDTSDILKCSASGPPVASATALPFIGPMKGERAQIPAISVNVMMKPGELDAGKEMQRRVGRYSADIIWHSMQLESQIRFISSRKKSYVAHAQPPGELSDIRSTVYDYIFPFEHSESLRLDMPVPPSTNSTAIIDIVPVVGALILTETNQSESEGAPISIERKLIGEACVSLTASIRGGRVKDVVVFQNE